MVTVVVSGGAVGAFYMYYQAKGAYHRVVKTLRPRYVPVADPSHSMRPHIHHIQGLGQSVVTI